MYRLSAFYFARTASDLPMELSLPAGYLIISYFMGGLRRDAGAFFANLLGSLLVTIVRLGTPAGQGFAGVLPCCEGFMQNLVPCVCWENTFVLFAEHRVWGRLCIVMSMCEV